LWQSTRLLRGPFIEDGDAVTGNGGIACLSGVEWNGDDFVGRSVIDRIAGQIVQEDGVVEPEPDDGCCIAGDVIELGSAGVAIIGGGVDGRADGGTGVAG
jgi:hypothetical protein